MPGPPRARAVGLAAGMALAGAGRSGPDADGADAAAPMPAEGAYGLVVLSHDADEAGVQVSGQFVRFFGPERARVLHALTLPEPAWLVAGGPAPGECRSVESDAALDDDDRIDLLSAGELQVAPPNPLEDALRLPPRELPFVHFGVSGVVYDADAPQALPHRAHGRYRLWAPGGAVGGFAASVDAPGAVHLRRVEVDATGLAVDWSGDGPAVVTLSRDEGARTVGVQCASTAGDRVSLPWSVLRALGPGEAQLSVARVASGPLRAPGLDDGQVVFIVRDTAEVRLPEAPGEGE